MPQLLQGVTSATMDDLTTLRHRYEQMAYIELRHALSEDFILDPANFVAQIGCRPEDVTSQQLREYYPHFVAADRQLISRHEGFKRIFREGRIF